MERDAGTFVARVSAQASIGPMLWQQTRSELLGLLRNPSFSSAALAMPVVMYAFVGPAHIAEQEQGIPWKQYVLASLGAYGVLSVALYAFGARVATERGQRIHILLRATPLPPWLYLVSKTITALLFAALTLGVLFVFAGLTTQTSFGAATYAALFVRLLSGLVPFLALGFAIGYLLSPNAAATVTGVIWIALSFASGLFLPLAQLPDWVRAIAPYLPTYRYAQLAWSVVGARSDGSGQSALWLIGYGVVFFGLAIWAYGREAALSAD